MGIGHRELGQTLPNGGGERGRRLGAPGRQLGGHLGELPLGGGEFALPRLERDIGVLQLVASLTAALGVPQDLRDRAAVLALEPREQRESLLNLLETSGRPFQSERVAPQLAAEILRLVMHRLQPLEQRRELRINAGHGLELRDSLSERRRDAAALVIVGGERLRSGRGRRLEALEVAQPVPLGAQCLLFVLARRGGLDLVELEGDQVELSITRPGQLLELRDSVAQITCLLVSGSDPLPALELRGAAVAVEDVELRRRDHQLPVLVLPVEREQTAPELPQVPDRRGAAADVRSRAAIGPYPPCQHELVGILRDPFLERLVEPRRAGEHAFHVGLARAGADNAAAGTAAQEEIEGVREQGLAGAGLAREHVKSRGEPELGPLHQQQVLDAQLIEHARGVPGGSDGSAR